MKCARACLLMHGRVEMHPARAHAQFTRQAVSDEWASKHITCIRSRTPPKFEDIWGTERKSAVVHLSDRLFQPPGNELGVE
jgi:hypothetical protein